MAYVQKTKQQVIAERKKTTDANAKIIKEKQMSPAQKGKPAAPKPAVKRPSVKPAPLPKPKPKPKVVQMPSKINPFKMTPAQKAQYLKNPERYDG